MYCCRSAFFTFFFDDVLVAGWVVVFVGVTGVTGVDVVGLGLVLGLFSSSGVCSSGAFGFIVFVGVGTSPVSPGFFFGMGSGPFCGIGPLPSFLISILLSPASFSVAVASFSGSFFRNQFLNCTQLISHSL